MLRSIWIAIAFALTAMSTAQAAGYPERPVRVIVGYAAGSGPDIQARTLSAQLSTSLGQRFFVENQLGANGTIAARSVAQAKPDGYTLLFSSSSITPTPYIYKNLGYNPKTDLEPIATVGQLDGMLMLVDAKSPIKSVKEFIDYAKKNRVLYGSPGVGNILHLATEMFDKAAGITMQHVPYKGASEVMTALLGGSIQVMFVTPPSVMGLVKDGRVRALAFTGTKPFPPFPDVPLMKDVLPGSEPMGSWGMFFAPGKTPKAIVDTLNGAIQKALLVPAVAQVMQRDGYYPDNRNAAETKAFFDKEIDRMKGAVKAAGIKPN
ncbi:MAG: tripartite tricarboxylate transporter substrate binding protein [Pseudolabrys sp.]|jgi:tripartite-type tricarboxylate transporter receptor subunit TctC